MTSGEVAYLFRHAVLREAVYQLQMPADRARLHALAFSIVEGLAGGRPPAVRLEDETFGRYRAHTTDPWAAELADHARRAVLEGDHGAFRDLHRLYTARAADFAEETFQDPRAEDLWKDYADASSGTGRGEALRRAADVARRRGRLGVAEDLLRRALEEFRAAGEERLAALATAQLAGIDRQRGRVEESERGYRAALETARSLGDRPVEALALTNLALLLQNTDRAREACRMSCVAIRLHRGLRDARAEGHSFGNLSGALRRLGRTTWAERAARRSVVLARAVHHRREEGQALVMHSTALLFRRRLDEADAALRSALAIHREVGNRPGEGVARGIQAAILFERGDAAGALAELDAAIAIHREVGNFRIEGQDLCNRAIALALLGRGAESGESWSAGSAILRAFRSESLLARLAADLRDACTRAGIPPPGGA